MSTDTHTFNIYSFHKNGELTKQAQIEETMDNYSMKMNPLPSAAQHMDLYLDELFNLMMKYEKEYPYNSDHTYKTKRYDYANGEFVEATIFHRVLMRKGSYFYVYQKSERGTRFLLFAMDRVHHSSVSLGFAMRIPNVFEQRKEMQEILRKSNIIINPSLIENSSLYFL